MDLKVVATQSTPNFKQNSNKPMEGPKKKAPTSFEDFLKIAMKK